MLYARTISRLARQLFSDVIGIGYVEGEIVQPEQSVCVPEKEETDLVNLMYLLDRYSNERVLMQEFIDSICTVYKININKVISTLLENDDKTRVNFETWKQTRNKNEKVINIDTNSNDVN